MMAGLLTILLVVAIGWPLTHGRDALRRLGIAYLAGAGLSFGVLLVASLLHVPWSRAVLVMPLLAIAITASIVRRRELAVTLPRMHWLDLFTLVVVIGYVRFAVLGPTPEYDFIGIWGVKAKEFWLAGGVDWGWLANPFNEFAHVDYPLLVPMVFDAQTLLAGGWPDRWLGLVNVGFGISALLVLRSFLDEDVAEPPLRALATLALAWTALSPWIGLAEVALVAYGTAGLLFLRRGETLRGAVLLGLAASCKNEGLTLIVAAAVALVIAGRRRDVLRLWPAGAIAAPWLVLRSAYQLQTDLTTGAVGPRVVQHLADIGSMLRAMQTYSLGKPFFWTAVVAALLLGVRRLGRERFLATAVIIQVLFFIAAYLITPHDVTWHVRWSWERVVTQLAAVIGFLAVVLIAPLLEDPPAATPKSDLNPISAGL